MKLSALKAGLFVCTIVFASSANAVPVTTWTVDVFTLFDTSSIVWDGPASGGTVVSSTSLRWGNDIGFGRSGLDITDSPSSTLVDTNGSPVANVTLTHINQPITGTFLDSVDIVSILTLTPFIPAAPGLLPAIGIFPVNFKETTNNDNPCADGGANGVGVNKNGCADIFVLGLSSLNLEFFYDDPDGEVSGRSYFISFFERTNGLNPLPSAACTAAGASAPCIGFETVEETNTPAQFAARITTEPVDVPEPTTLALMGLGLAGIGFRRRRQIKKA